MSKDILLGKKEVKSMPDCLQRHTRTTPGYPEALRESGKMGDRNSTNNNSLNRKKKRAIIITTINTTPATYQAQRYNLHFMVEKTEVFIQRG